MLPTLRSRVALVLGVVMIVLGALLLAGTFIPGRRPVTGSVVFDLAFAALFLLRGFMNFRQGRRPRAIPPQTPR